MNVESVNDRLLFPIPEARKQLGDISHSGFYKLVNQGLIRLTKIGRRSFVTRDELLAFVAARGQDAGANLNLAADDSRESRPSAA